MDNKNMEFMQIAMKYLPEAQEKLKEAGIEFSPALAEPFFGLFMSVMQEAYDLGKKDTSIEE
ncbi:ComZ family protein [Domibacillus epiphyticus]|uniref:Competence protein ComG n=1 Tax=Domibacillus epiphyticus TaxID=1714355 RepID=A0A1V2A8F7_9BACI|nr:ComZ family protein [Domibacillus epiphyticus]OMP67104.1 competence protein ComG [Domibacillus epiphyticus]